MQKLMIIFSLLFSFNVWAQKKAVWVGYATVGQKIDLNSAWLSFDCPLDENSYLRGQSPEPNATIFLRDIWGTDLEVKSLRGSFGIGENERGKGVVLLTRDKEIYISHAKDMSKKILIGSTNQHIDDYKSSLKKCRYMEGLLRDGLSIPNIQQSLTLELKSSAKVCKNNSWIFEGKEESEIDFIDGIVKLIPKQTAAFYQGIWRQEVVLSNGKQSLSINVETTAFEIPNDTSKFGSLFKGFATEEACKEFIRQ